MDAGKFFGWVHVLVIILEYADHLFIDIFCSSIGLGARQLCNQARILYKAQNA